MPQTLVKNILHIIFSTKNREALIADKGVRRELYAYLSVVLKELDSQAITIGGTADHVHILCNLSKKLPLAKTVGELKRNASKWMKTKGGKLTGFQWQRGYAAFSVGIGHLSRVRNYIANQEKQHRQTTFQEELRSLLKQQGIEFDERYLWD